MSSAKNISLAFYVKTYFTIDAIANIFVYERLKIPGVFRTQWNI